MNAATLGTLIAKIRECAGTVIVLVANGHPRLPTISLDRTADAAGNCCLLELPVRRADLQAALVGVPPIATRPAIPPIARSTVARSERKILLAEDNVVNQRVALSMLQSLSYYATLAQDGKDALDALAKEEFDIVLMNCHMPNMDGFEAVVAIRNNESGRSTGPRQYIGAVTANAINGERERCLAAEFDDYLSKPFTRAQLAELIERSPIAKAIGA